MNNFNKYFKKIKMLFLMTFFVVGANVFASGNKKVLVAYYSDTERTEGIAKIIAEETKGDLLKLEAKIPYTDADLNWRDKNSRVVREHENIENVHVELKNSKVSNFNEYDVIYIGFPVWWGEAAWVVNDFIKDNDFTGKTIFSFGTSITSGIGETVKKFRDMAGGVGAWKTGKRFSSYYKEDEVKNWVQRTTNN